MQDDPSVRSELNQEAIRSILESLLFINEKPIALDELSDILEVPKKEIEAFMSQLAAEYSSRASGVCIVQVAGGYQMCSAPNNEPWVKKMYRERSKQKLSGASLETLAIIAYKQPIARIEMEAIRGVNIDGVIRHLLGLGLIKTEGRKEVIGRPFLYVTTRKFLEYFGLNTLKDLPKLEEFTALAHKDHLVEEQSSQGSLEHALDQTEVPQDSTILQEQADIPETDQGVIEEVSETNPDEEKSQAGNGSVVSES